MGAACLRFQLIANISFSFGPRLRVKVIDGPRWLSFRITVSPCQARLPDIKVGTSNCFVVFLLLVIFFLLFLSFADILRFHYGTKKADVPVKLVSPFSHYNKMQMDAYYPRSFCFEILFLLVCFEL